jgi:cytochrome bd-type quinol oxidase subunit 2
MARSDVNPEIRRWPGRNPQRDDNPIAMPTQPTSTLDKAARVLIWAALGWTVAMLILLIFVINLGHERTFFQRHGILVPILALIPIAIVALPLLAGASRRAKRITPIVAMVTAGLVVLSIVLAGVFFLPAAFALATAALLEIADSGESED